MRKERVGRNAQVGSYGGGGVSLLPPAGGVVRGVVRVQHRCRACVRGSGAPAYGAVRARPKSSFTHPAYAPAYIKRRKGTGVSREAQGQEVKEECRQ